MQRSRNLSHELAGTRRMFARIGRDVDAELAAQAAAEARGDKGFKKTLYRCPRQFADPESPSGEDTDWFFDQSVKGVVTLLLTDLLDMRAAVRQAQKKVKYGGGEWLCFEGQQLACKLIANSTYGATGVTVGRIAFMVIGATVTGEGKVTIKNVHDKIIERYPDAVVRTFCAGGKHAVISYPCRSNALRAGDTDSVFFGIGHLGTTADVGRWICEVESFCNTLVEKPMKIEFEKEFENGYLALAKKRYAFNNVGFKAAYETPFDDEDEEMCERVNAHAVAHGRPPPFDIALERTRKWKRLRMDPVSQLKSKGMEVRRTRTRARTHARSRARAQTVRRDSCEYVRETLGRVLSLVVEHRAPERALEYVRAQAQALLAGRVPLHKLVMSKHYSKVDYATRSLPHLTVIEKCEQRGVEVPELGSRISFLITRGAKGSKAFQRAETVEYVLEHQLPIDYEYYLENQFIKPVLRILDWVFGFSVQCDTKRRYATALSVKPLLIVDTVGGGGAAPATLREMLGLAPAAPRRQRFVHVVEVPAGAPGADARRALGTLAARVEPVPAKPRQFFVTAADDAKRGDAEALPDDLRALVDGGTVALVATKRVWRENGYVYTSIAHGRAFAGLERGGGGKAAAAAGGGGIMRFARPMRACVVPGCLAQTHAEMCDTCLAERPGDVRAALDAVVAGAAQAYEETLPVCRRCSGNYDTATEIECANADCEHFYPRRVAEHAKRRCEQRRAAADVEIEAAARGTARKRMRALSERV